MKKHKRIAPPERGPRQYISLFAAAVFFLFIVSVVQAIPPPPPQPPTDTSFPSGYEITIDIPGFPDVNSSVTINYTHTAPTALYCNLTVNGSVRSAMFKGSKTESFTLPNGTHTASASCTNTTLETPLTKSSGPFNVDDEVSASPTVVLVSPQQTSPLNATVKFWHNAPAEANCTLKIDGEIAKQYRNLEPYTNSTSFKVPFEDEDEYRFNVFCKAGLWNASVTRDVDVSDEYLESEDTLEFLPETIFVNAEVTINGDFGEAYIGEDINISIRQPNSKIYKTTKAVGTNGILKLKFTPNQTGKYTVRFIAEDDTELNGSFTAKERVPDIRISGNLSNVTAGTAFTVLGEQFLPLDTINISIVGGGATVPDSIKADTDGEFAFTAPKTLAVGSYEIIAKSRSTPAHTDKTKITIIAANITPPIVCGDGKKEGAEECDAGAENGVCPDTCSSTCKKNNCPAPAVCGNGKVEGSEECDRGASNGACPKTCSTSCENNFCQDEGDNGGGIGGDVGGGDDGGDDFGDDEPIDPDVNEPSSINFAWIWYVVIAIVVLGGGLGYFIWNGTIDLSAITGAKQMPGMPSGSYSGAQSTPMSYADEQTIKSFIFGERAKGFDDLTIRGALLSKGWDKDEVDHVFDEVYKS